MKHKLDYEDVKTRELVGKAFYMLNPKNFNKCKNENTENKMLKTLVSDQLLESIRNDYDRLTAIRNDINHANFRKENRKPEDIEKEINDIINEIANKLI